MDDPPSVNSASGSTRTSFAQVASSVIEQRLHNLDIEGQAPSTPPGTSTPPTSSSNAAAPTAVPNRSHPTDQLDTSGASASGATAATDATAGGAGGSSPANSSNVAKTLNTEGLPEGWTMQVAPNGRVSTI